MDYKPMVMNEIELNETPVEFQEVVNEKLTNDDKFNLIKVTKIIEYPYIDKTKEMVSYKAYIAGFNLIMLVSKYGVSDRVSVDSMTIGDYKVFLEYWNRY